MASAWEVWALAALALFEFAVAYWWWRGPRLEGTKWWITALFLLNGSTTLANAALEVPVFDHALIDGLGSLADKTANLCLLAFAMLAYSNDTDRGLKFLGGLVGIGFLVSLPFTVSQLFGTQSGPIWAQFFLNLPLWMAVFVTAAALIRLTQQQSRSNAGLWLLAVSGIGFRFAELSAWLGLGRLNGLLSGRDGFRLLQILLEVLAFPAMLIAFGWLLWKRTQNDTSPLRGKYEVALTLLLAGFLFGFARSISSRSMFAVLFSLGFIRPGVFLALQWQLDGKPVRETPQWHHLQTGGTAVGASLLGIPLGALFGMEVPGSLFVGGMLAVFGFGLARQLVDSDPSPAGGQRGRRRDLSDLPLDPEEVTLPEEWRERTLENAEAYDAIPSQIQDRVDELSRWQRILLVLYGAPEGEQLPAYERTTPGLHFLTHCPYPIIGSEISRTNDRCEEVLEEVGISKPSGGSLSDESLIESRLGRAQGLGSPRAKSYSLTPLGETVAEHILEELGLEDRAPEEVARVVGESHPAILR